MEIPAPSYPAGLGAHLGAIVADLRAIFHRNRLSTPVAPSVLILFWNYLNRAIRRLDRLQESWRTGCLPPPRPSRAGIARPARAATPRLPGRQGWLIHVIQPAAQLRGHLQILLARPEMVELLAAAPQAGRILRPLCRMFAIAPLPAEPHLPATTTRRTAAPMPPPPHNVHPTPAPPDAPARELSRI